MNKWAHPIKLNKVYTGPWKNQTPIEGVTFSLSRPLRVCVWAEGAGGHC